MCAVDLPRPSMVGVSQWRRAQFAFIHRKDCGGRPAMCAVGATHAPWRSPLQACAMRWSVICRGLIRNPIFHLQCVHHRFCQHTWSARRLRFSRSKFKPSACRVVGETARGVAGGCGSSLVPSPDVRSCMTTLMAAPKSVPQCEVKQAVPHFRRSQECHR